MTATDQVIARWLERPSRPLRLRLPTGRTLGPDAAPVEILFHNSAALARLASGNLRALAGEIVDGQCLGIERDARPDAGGRGPRRRWQHP